MSSRPTVSVVIGSGGVKCAAAIGLWSVLSEANVAVDSLVGCSGGSLYAAAIAQGWEPDKMRTLSESLWTGDVMQGYRENLKASKDGSFRFTDRSGLVDDSVLNENLEKIYGDLTFADLDIPLTLVATDLHNGEKVLLSEGLVRDAIRASIAIPVIFPPLELNGRLLIDGGASDPLPVDVAIQEAADVIIAMGFTLSYRTRFRSITAVQEQLTSIYTNQILNATYAFHNLAHHAEIFPVMPDLDEQVSMFDVDKIPRVIEAGAEAAQTQIPHILRALQAAH